MLEESETLQGIIEDLLNQAADHAARTAEAMPSLYGIFSGIKDAKLRRHADRAKELADRATDLRVEIERFMEHVGFTASESRRRRADETAIFDHTRFAVDFRKLTEEWTPEERKVAADYMKNLWTKHRSYSGNGSSDGE